MGLDLYNRAAGLAANCESSLFGILQLEPPAITYRPIRAGNQRTPTKIIEMNSIQDQEVARKKSETDQAMSDTRAVIAVYNTHPEAEAAVNELQRAGFDVKKLSVVGKGYHTDEQVVGYYNAGDRMRHWGKLGALWGGLWGLLFGAAFFWVPGIGPLLVAGPLTASIVAALESAVVVGGLSVVGAALYSSGIPKDSVVRYETAIRADKFLLVGRGANAEIAKAKEILTSTNPVEVNDHILKPTSETVLR